METINTVDVNRQVKDELQQTRGELEEAKAAIIYLRKEVIFLNLCLKTLYHVENFALYTSLYFQFDQFKRKYNISFSRYLKYNYHGGYHQRYFAKVSTIFTKS